MEFGIDRLPHCAPLLQRLRGAKVGVLGHAASVDRGLQHLLEVLLAAEVKPAALFAPEHGFGGAAQDMIGIEDARDPLTGAPVHSLYGDALDKLIPSQAQLEPLDVLVIDLNDVGSRYYTYVWTALLSARAAAKANVHCVLLDRPNPLGGAPEQVEGATQQPGFTSFVGWERVPIRHGLTLAEMVCLHAQQDGLALGPDGALSCLPLNGWQRSSFADGWDRPFVLPSPNMPTLDTALVYPGGCLLEGTNLSDGRGHTRPFEITGAPWLDGRRLASELQALALPGFVARPLSFIPTFHKHAGQSCGGVQIHVSDRARFRPVAVYAALIALAQRQAPQDFRFRTECYEFVDDIPALDLLTGSAAAREAMLAGDDVHAIAGAASAVDPAWAETQKAAIASATAASWA